LFVSVFLFVYCLLFISLLLLYVMVNKDYHRTVKVGGPASWGSALSRWHKDHPAVSPVLVAGAPRWLVSALVLGYNNCVWDINSTLLHLPVPSNNRWQIAPEMCLANLLTIATVSNQIQSLHAKVGHHHSTAETKYRRKH